MADYTVAPAPATAHQPPVTAALVAYILFAAAAILQVASSGLVVPAPLLTFIGIVGVIVAYVKRSDARGTWLESHMTWLIRTFWWSLLWNCIGWVLAVTLIGLPVALAIWIATTIWVIYRVIRGFLYFHRNEPIPGI